MPTTIARVVASICVIVAGVLILIAHRRRPELPASEIALSVYFTDPTRNIMISAYAAIAAALFSVSVVVTTQMRATTAVIAVACCIGAILLAPVVATTQRDITITRSEATRRVHRYAATSAFSAIGVALAVSAYVAIVDGDMPVAILRASRHFRGRPHIATQTSLYAWTSTEDFACHPWLVDHHDCG